MRIKSLQLNNVGVFENELIEFKPCPSKSKAEIHIFTGTNGTGKSTLLKAIAASFTRYSDGNYEYEIYDNSFEKYFRQQKSSFEPTFEHKGQNFQTSKENDDFSEYLYVINRPNLPTRDVSFCALAYSGNRRLFATHSIDGHNLQMENPLYYALKFDQIPNQKFVISDWLKNSLLKRGYAKSENIKIKEELHNDIINKIEELIYRITGKKVIFKLDLNLNKTVLQYDGNEIEFEVLPDGLKSIISWVADLCMRLVDLPWENNTPIFDRNIILLLDEIEIHLHIEWQRKILPAIQDLFPNAQIFISTHSPFVVNSVDDAWVYNLEVKKGNAHVRKVELSQDGKSFTSVLRNIFGVKETFGPAIEKDLTVFKGLIAKALDKSITSKEEKELAKIAQKLAQEGTELESIVGFEMRQVEKLNKKELVQ